MRCGEGNPLEVNLIHLEKGTPWIGGDPQEANPIRFGEGDSPEANPILCGEGEPLEVNFIHLEKEKGTPLKRIPFAVERGGTPWGESHPLGEGDPLLRRGGTP